MLAQVVAGGRPIEEVVIEMRHSTYIRSLALSRNSSSKGVPTP